MSVGERGATSHFHLLTIKRTPDILAVLQKVQRPAFAPGQKYQYCNGGYVLLALIVENISGDPLPRFLETRVFKPLGMTSTFVLTSSDQKTADVARGYDGSGGADDFEGMATGDGGVYSTVKDLLRFDQALYTDALVAQQTLADAFTPAHVRQGRTTYGFGWNIVTDPTVWRRTDILCREMDSATSDALLPRILGGVARVAEQRQLVVRLSVPRSGFEPVSRLTASCDKMASSPCERWSRAARSSNEERRHVVQGRDLAGGPDAGSHRRGLQVCLVVGPMPIRP